MGDSVVDAAFTAIFYDQWKISEKFDSYFPRGKYGTQPDLILLECFVEGTHPWFTMPDTIKIGRYGPKDNSIGIKIPVRSTISSAVLSEDTPTVNAFLTATFTQIGDLILRSKPLDKLNFNKTTFNGDWHVFMQHLLDDSPQ